MMNLESKLIEIDINKRRISGISDEEIATQMGLSLDAIRQVTFPKVDLRRQAGVQHMQRQKMIQSLMPKAEAGDPEAIALILKIHRAEADRLGLDAPKQTVMTLTKDPTDVYTMSTDKLELMAAGKADIIDGEFVELP